jgi:SnoaL-like domain
LNPAQQLLACEAIKILKARYFRFVDAQQWDSLRELFTPDMQFYFPEARLEPYGLAAGMNLIVQVLTDCQSIHHGFMPEIRVQNPERATGIWAMEDRLTWTAAAAAKSGIKTLHGFGRYFEEYRHGEAGWQIQRLELVRSRVTTTAPAD